LGITQFLGNASPSTKSRFAIGEPEVPSFTTRTDMDRTRFYLSAGVDIWMHKSLTTRAEVFGSFSDNSKGYSGGLTFSVPF